MSEVSNEDKVISEKSMLRLMNHCKAEINNKVSGIEEIIPSSASTSNKLATMADIGSGGGGGGYVLPPATSNTLGGVKIGTGVDVASDGAISVNLQPHFSTTTETVVAYVNENPVYAKVFEGSNDVGEEQYVDLLLPSNATNVSIIAALSYKIVNTSGVILPYGYYYSSNDKFMGYYRSSEHVVRLGGAPGMPAYTYRVVVTYQKS